MVDQCPIPWENVGSNVTFEYSISGTRFILSVLEGNILSVCINNGSWYPNPADIVCTQPNQGLFATQFYLILNSHLPLHIIVKGTVIALVPLPKAVYTQIKYSLVSYQ